jgi:hypothetical protein
VLLTGGSERAVKGLVVSLVIIGGCVAASPGSARPRLRPGAGSVAPAGRPEGSTGRAPGG